MGINPSKNKQTGVHISFQKEAFLILLISPPLHLGTKQLQALLPSPLVF